MPPGELGDDRERGRRGLGLDRARRGRSGAVMADPQFAARPSSNCRTGSASKNSLATTSSGPSAGRRREIVVPARRGTRSAWAARSTGLVSTKCDRRARGRRRASPAAHPRRACRGPGRARHSAPSRPPGAQPEVGEPDADQLAEHLADLGRGGEVALGAERIAGRVIMRVRLGHVVGDRDRALGGDHGAFSLSASSGSSGSSGRRSARTRAARSSR